MGKANNRNEPCPCGSGKKYKQCCLGKPPPKARRRSKLLSICVAALGLGLAIVLAITSGVVSGIAAGGAVLVIAGLVYVIRDPPPPQAGGRKGSAGINFGK